MVDLNAHRQTHDSFRDDCAWCRLERDAWGYKHPLAFGGIPLIRKGRGTPLTDSRTEADRTPIGPESSS